jgi:hypothetical protein
MGTPAWFCSPPHQDGPRSWRSGHFEQAIDAPPSNHLVDLRGIKVTETNSRGITAARQRRPQLMRPAEQCSDSSTTNIEDNGGVVEAHRANARGAGDEPTHGATEPPEMLASSQRTVGPLAATARSHTSVVIIGSKLLNGTGSPALA